MQILGQNPSIHSSPIRSIFFKLFLSTMSSSSSSNIIAEYAKSNRSSCKKCSASIDAKSLRLGVVTKDSRGYDMTRWHHLTCLPFSSTSISSVDSIRGFSSLKSSDQEVLMEMMAGNEQTEQKITDGDQDSVKESKKENSKVPPGNEDEEKSNSKIIAEYAKSGRSSCKRCSTAIESKSLRLGLFTRDSRGFDMTKWHHLSCFPFSSTPISSVEAIGGFPSLESCDQEVLKKLMEVRDESEEKIVCEDIDAVERSKRTISKVHTGDEDEVKKDAKKTKVPGLDLSFSVSNIQDKYKDATLLPKWKAFQTIIFLERDDGLHDSSKIAAFDFDQCLAKTSMKRVGPDAWSLMYPSIPEKLQSLYNDGYKLVIFTNESNIDRWKNKRQVAVDSKIGRLNNFVKKVGVPVQVFVACGIGKPSADPFRKPEPGMWFIMEHHFNSGIKIDMDQSFYVGDAAGRPDDHSDADIKFAEAIGLKFYVPEDYFQ